MGTIRIKHPKHGEATVDEDQWNEKGHATGWDEASARANGWEPIEEPKAGKKKADKKPDPQP